jgi:two-component system chemotaxis response regulator CheY
LAFAHYPDFGNLVEYDYHEFVLPVFLKILLFNNTPQTMKVLAVDDSMLIRRIVASAASVIGADCIPAGDGHIALGVLESDPQGFSLVCLDWNMPNMNGLEFLTRMRADERWKSLPVLMLTTEGSRDAIITAIKAGATAYMTKPFFEKDLQAKMLDCLGLGFE